MVTYVLLLCVIFLKNDLFRLSSLSSKFNDYQFISERNRNSNFESKRQVFLRLNLPNFEKPRNVLRNREIIRLKTLIAK